MIIYLCCLKIARLKKLLNAEHLCNTEGKFQGYDHGTSFECELPFKTSVILLYFMDIPTRISICKPRDKKSMERFPYYKGFLATCARG